jgi:hypothetical protein
MATAREARKAKRRACTMLALVASLALAPSAAGAADPIEGIWSFNGGRVAIQQLPGGGFVGTVTSPTTFALCAHPIGEPMWTGIHRDADGSYAGFHQWFFESASCQPNPVLGRTAWRVLQAGGGRHYLRACFSEPGKPEPTIAPDGVASDASYGCVNSALIAPLPAQGVSFNRAVLLPPTRKCLSRRAFRIHLLDPKNDPFKRVTVRLRGRRIVTSRKADVISAFIDLQGFSKGTFTISVRVLTVLGHHINGSRTYHTCAKKAHKRGTHARG